MVVIPTRFTINTTHGIANLARRKNLGRSSIALLAMSIFTERVPHARVGVFVLVLRYRSGENDPALGTFHQSTI